MVSGKISAFRELDTGTGLLQLLPGTIPDGQ